jgi:hypothetical protein
MSVEIKENLHSLIAALEKQNEVTPNTFTLRALNYIKAALHELLLKELEK